MNQLKEGQTTILKNQRALSDNSTTLARRATWILGTLITVSMALNFYMFVRWGVATTAIKEQTGLLHEEIQDIHAIIKQEDQ